MFVCDETEQTYVWLLEQFIDTMKGKALVFIITDGDLAMKNAIEVVFLVQIISYAHGS